MHTIHVPHSAIHRGKLILVNAAHPYVEAFASPGLVPVQEDMAFFEPQGPGASGETIQLERNAATLLSALMNEIAGWTDIVPVSGWRSFEEQTEIFSSSMKQNGLDFTRKYVAKPGHSEHHTGLAIDLGQKQASLDFIRPEFPYSGICQTFRSRASQFGYVERYPADKENITGIGHEPWHFRYVGMPHSAIMAERNFSLEEYIDFLEACATMEQPLEYHREGLNVSIYYLKVSRLGDVWLEVDPAMPYTVSGDNKGGLVVSVWDEANRRR